jgi:hypothetical protein
MPDTLSGRDFTTYRAYHVGSNVEVEFESDGQKRSATVLECDAEKARLETDFKPEVGAVIQIGRVRSRVVRHLPKAILIEFLSIDD